MDCFFSKQGTMYLYRWKSVQSFHNGFVRYLHCLLNCFSLYHFCCHTGSCNRCTAAKSLKLYITDNLIFVDIQINSHDISTFCVSYCTYSARILNFPYISRMLKMIHYLFCIHSDFPPLISDLIFFLFLFSFLSSMCYLLLS